MSNGVWGETKYLNYYFTVKVTMWNIMQMFKNKTWKCVIYLGAKLFTFHPLIKHNLLIVKNLIKGQVFLIMPWFLPPLIQQP